jgi:hypothetical protein
MGWGGGEGFKMSFQANHDQISGFAKSITSITGYDIFTCVRKLYNIFAANEFHPDQLEHIAMLCK